MRILVTGAGGFVGAHLLPALSKAGHEVIAASHRPWDPPMPVEIDVFDVRDRVRVQEVMDARRPDAVIHLAAQASVRRSWEATEETFAVNVTGTSHLLESLADRPETRVLLVGSAQQYGLPDGGRPLLETDPLQPRSPYGVSKVAQELVGALYRRHFGLPVIVALYYTPPAATDPDHILTMLRRILTSMVRIGPRGNRACLCYNSPETSCRAHHSGGVLRCPRRGAMATSTLAMTPCFLLTRQRQEHIVCPILLFRAWIRTLNRPTCGQTLITAWQISVLNNWPLFSPPNTSPS